MGRLRGALILSRTHPSRNSGSSNRNVILRPTTSGCRLHSTAGWWRIYHFKVCRRWSRITSTGGAGWVNFWRSAKFFIRLPAIAIIKSPRRNPCWAAGEFAGNSKTRTPPVFKATPTADASSIVSRFFTFAPNHRVLLLNIVAAVFSFELEKEGVRARALSEGFCTPN